MTDVADPIGSLVREADFGRYAASLFAPAHVRPHLLALYAFDVEIARVRDLVSEPMPGELRLQWWRDAIENPERADAVSHPIAHALEGAIGFGRLPREALIGVIDARIDDLYDDPVATLSDLEGRLGATHGAVMRLAMLIAAEGRDPGGGDAAGYGGVAQGIARLLRQFPRHAARGQVLVPSEMLAAHGASLDEATSGNGGPGLAQATGELSAHAVARLGEARAAAAAVDPAAYPALLPLALTGPELKRLQRARAPFAPPAETAGWRTLLGLWMASRKRPPF